MGVSYKVRIKAAAAHILHDEENISCNKQTRDALKCKKNVVN